MSTPKRIVRPEVLSDLAEAAGPALTDEARFRKSFAIMRRAAEAARKRFPTWQEQREHSVSSVVRFVENTENLLSSIKKKVDEEFGSAGRYGKVADAERIRGFILGGSESMLVMGIYHIQYELACMNYPETGEAGPDGSPVHRITELFRADNDISWKLGAFLDSIGVSRSEFRDAIESMRDFFLARSGTNNEIREHKQRVIEAFRSLMESYIEFHIASRPLAEGPME